MRQLNDLEHLIVKSTWYTKILTPDTNDFVHFTIQTAIFEIETYKVNGNRKINDQNYPDTLNTYPAYSFLGCAFHTSTGQ